MNLLQPVSVTRLYRMIANQIAGKIRAGEFRPGERLPSERELAEKLQVSRPSVREALIALEIEGYVDVRVGTGVFVAPTKAGGGWHGAEPDETNVSHRYGDIGPFDLLETRLLIEPECAELAAKNASGAQIEEIIAAAHMMPNAESPGVHDRNFHVAIAEASGNVALAATVANLWQLRESSAIFSRLEQHFVTRKVWLVAETEHDKIIQAIQDRDIVAARQAMHMHLTGIQSRLREDFSSDAAI